MFLHIALPLLAMGMLLAALDWHLHQRFGSGHLSARLVRWATLSCLGDPASYRANAVAAFLLGVVGAVLGVMAVGVFVLH